MHASLCSLDRLLFPVFPLVPGCWPAVLMQSGSVHYHCSEDRSTFQVQRGVDQDTEGPCFGACLRLSREISRSRVSSQSTQPFSNFLAAALFLLHRNDTSTIYPIFCLMLRMHVHYAGKSLRVSFCILWTDRNTLVCFWFPRGLTNQSTHTRRLVGARDGGGESDSEDCFESHWSFNLQSCPVWLHRSILQYPVMRYRRCLLCLWAMC